MGDGERMNEWKNEPKGENSVNVPFLLLFFFIALSFVFLLFPSCWCNYFWIVGRWGREREASDSIYFYSIGFKSIRFCSIQNIIINSYQHHQQCYPHLLYASHLLASSRWDLRVYSLSLIRQYLLGRADKRIFFLVTTLQALLATTTQASLGAMVRILSLLLRFFLLHVSYLCFPLLSSFFCCLSFCRCKGTTDGGCKNKDMSSIGERISCSIRNIRSMCLRIDSPRKNSRRSLAMSMSDGMFGSRNTMSSMPLQVGGKWLAYVACLSSSTRIPSW